MARKAQQNGRESTIDDRPQTSPKSGKMGDGEPEKL
jgi:hypothetical protein